MEAVKGVSFSVGEREIFSLIGPNGAGKSTTLKMIATILGTSGGTVTVAGFSLATQAAEIRKVISYLPEEAGAYKNLTGRQYLEFMGGLYTSDASKLREYITYAENITRLGKRLEDKVRTYSKGMTRKLLLARTVMTKPKLAILDEPTSGLDIVNALDIRTTIKDLAKDGMSVLLSSHNMLEIELMSDRLAIITQGEIKASGTATELKTAYGAQNLEEVFVHIAKTKGE